MLRSCGRREHPRQRDGGLQGTAGEPKGGCGVGRVVSAGDRVEGGHLRGTRHWFGQETVVAAGCFGGITRVTPDCEARARSVRDIKSGKVCLRKSARLI